MEELFTPEVIDKVLSVLETAAEGSVFVLAVYFLVPFLMLCVTAAAWVWGTIRVAQTIKDSIKYLYAERPVVEKVERVERVVKLEERMLSGSGDMLLELIERVTGAGKLLHDSDIKWLSVAVSNQKRLDADNGGSKYSPHVIKD